MIAEFKSSGYTTYFNYVNPALKFYCEESFEIVDDSVLNVNKKWHNCLIDKSYFLIEKSAFKEIIVPYSPRHEIFYIYENLTYSLFDNYFDAIDFLDESNKGVSVDEIERFHSKMSCNAGKTFHSNIRRLVPGYRYFLDEGILTRESYMPILGMKMGFIDFKYRFEACINYATKGKEVGVLLSGGVDSTAVALAAAKFCKSIRTYTMKYLPLQAGTDSDAIIAGITSERNGWKHYVTHVDFEIPEKGLIEYYSREIPLVCGLPHGYDALLKSMNSDNIEIALTGQNADLLTFFGATSDVSLNREGIISLMRRLFFSKYYCAYIENSNHNGYKAFGFIIYLIGYFVAMAFSIFKKEKYRQPRDIFELFYFGVLSSDTIPFVNKDFNRNSDNVDLSVVPDDLNGENFHFHLLRHKLGVDMMLADSQLIKVAGRKNNVLVEFPFSYNPLVFFFMNRNLNLKSIFVPKSFIKDFIFEYYPGYNKKIKNKSNHVSFGPHDWAQKLMDSGFVPKHKDGVVRTKFGELYFNVSKVWIEEFYKFLKK